MVIVIGDIIVDEYVWGNSSRFSPEEPEVRVIDVTSSREDWRLGGAANVAARVSGTGTRAALLGVVGRDRWGRRVAEHFPARLPTVGPVVDSARPTTVKTRVMDGDRQVARLDVESRAPVDREIELRLLKLFRAVLSYERCQVIVISDYGKGVVTDAVCRDVISLAAELGSKVIVDPRRVDFSAYAGAYLVTPNQVELEATGMTPRELQALTGAAILHKRGPLGLSLHDGDDEWRLEAPSTRPVDVTGAGDAVVASVAVSLSAGLPLVEATRRARDAAAQAISEVGTARPTRRERSA